MKIRINVKGGLAVLLACVFIAGCSAKKSVVTSDAAQSKETLSKTEQPQETATAREKSVSAEDIDAEKSVDLEKMARMSSPVKDINFDFDSSAIRPDAREILKENASYFIQHRVSSVIIEGHCDERGTAEYNMALGERRAQETKNYLVNLGVSPSIMKTVSFGEENPLDPASNEEAWAKNRRAHFVVHP